MKTKLIFITILGLILFGVLFMQYGHVPSIDCIGGGGYISRRGCCSL